MSGGPYSRERRQGSLRIFGRIAIVAGPVVLVIAAVMAFGLWPGPDDDGSGPFELKDTAAAGESMLVQEADATVVLWASPSSTDVAAVTCTTRDGALAVDGAPQISGPTERTDVEGAHWTRIAVVEGMNGSVTCDGGGLTQAGQQVLASEVDGGRGGVFFGVWGVIITLAGLLAVRISRRQP